MFVQTVLCLKNHSHMRLSNESFRQPHLWTSVQTVSCLNGCSDRISSERYIIYNSASWPPLDTWWKNEKENKSTCRSRAYYRSAGQKYEPKPSLNKPNCPKHLGFSNFCECGLYTKFQTPITISCTNFKLSGGWSGGWLVGWVRYIIMPLRGPNLQVRTCKIQAKLDSKLGLSVTIFEIKFLKHFLSCTKSSAKGAIYDIFFFYKSDPKLKNI